MKKFLFIILAFVISMFAVGCEIVLDSQPYDNHDTMLPSGPPPSGKTYVKVDILDENEKHLNTVTSSTEIHYLDLNKDYYLRVSVGPGSRFVEYEGSHVEHNDQEVFIKEMSEKYFGEIYLLRGLKEGQFELTAVVISNKLTLETIQRKMIVEFTSNN